MLNKLKASEFRALKKASKKEIYLSEEEDEDESETDE